MGIRSKISGWIQKQLVNVLASDSTKQEIKKIYSGFLKEEIMTVLSDEEVAHAVIGYGDSLYDRYHAKFTGFLGGTQKGINSVLSGNGESRSKILGNLDIGGLSPDNLNLKTLVQLMLMGGGSQGSPSHNGNVGVMT